MMTAPEGMETAADLLRSTELDQLTAADPSVSAWVSANAGAGKTHVLKSRVLRLLLGGTKPDRILCLTYTKAAAAEMSARVFGDLAVWATCEASALALHLERVLGRGATSEELAAARRLFARAIETPGGLKVQTIHAFCERLLQRFPLEAGVPPGFSILDDETTGELKREAIDQVLGQAVRDKGAELSTALHTMIAFAAEDGFDEILSRVIGERSWLDSLSRLALIEEDRFSAIAVHYRRAFSVRENVDGAEIDAQMAEILPAEFLEYAGAVLQEGGKLDKDLGDGLKSAARTEDVVQRVRLLERAFLTAEKQARSDSRFVSKAMRGAHPEVAERLVSARNRFEGLVKEKLALGVIDATLALIRFADRVQQAYSDAKARRAGLDFEDLIVHTSHLLQGASAAEWVLYKLDGGLDHILVDEAQDTSPEQWTIVDFLAREFFSGSGARDSVRTLFAVGDEKQSIYSFQGAAPHMFAEAGGKFLKLATLAGAQWHRVSLKLSFRTVTPVLTAVDSVFSDARRTPGVTSSDGEIRHHAFRIGQAGLVEMWPTEAYEEVQPSDLWQPGGEGAGQSTERRLTERIAELIAGWLKNGEILESENRRVTPGDILILVRRRQPFAEPMVAALKARGIPVAGADRMMLADQVVVQDLLALSDFLTLPEDDLALATVLKSPMFGFSDDDLFDLAYTRRGMLWSTLLGAARNGERYSAAAEALKRWRAQSDIKPPFEFFSALLDRDGMRARFLKRLGAEAIDPLDELLNLSIAFDDKATPSLTGFSDYVRKARRELKRDMEHGRDEVRVMTVHGAKGLEAPIVFLPDTCARGSAGRGQDIVRIGQVDAFAEPFPLFAWTIKGAGSLPVVKAAKEAIATREGEERNRLLYVAMTRARDRLYIGGFEGKKGRAKGCWYDLIDEALAGHLETVPAPSGGEVRRLCAAQFAPVEPVRALTSGLADVQPLPEWALRIAPAEAQITIPIAPSRLAPLETDETGDPSEPHPADDGLPFEAGGGSPVRQTRDSRLARGIITHALLEHLPTLPVKDRAGAARAFVAVRGQALGQKVRENIVREVIKVLEEPEFADVFGPEARAEVPIVAEVRQPEGRQGPPLRIVGQIDRLLVSEDEVVIVDYKTNRSPPADADSVSPAYLYQLAAYRLAVAQIFDAKPVRAAILWTDGPDILTIPAAILDAYEQRLWQLDPARLDALASHT